MSSIQNGIVVGNISGSGVIYYELISDGFSRTSDPELETKTYLIPSSGNYSLNIAYYFGTYPTLYKVWIEKSGVIGQPFIIALTASTAFPTSLEALRLGYVNGSYPNYQSASVYPNNVSIALNQTINLVFSGFAANAAFSYQWKNVVTNQNVGSSVTGNLNSNGNYSTTISTATLATNLSTTNGTFILTLTVGSSVVTSNQLKLSP